MYVLWNRTYDPLIARVKSVDGNAGATLVSTTGSEHVLTDNNMTDGAYNVYLPGCSAPCFIQGEPQILVQNGDPQDAWVVIDDAAVLFKP